MKVRLAKKQMKKARPFWESQGFKFKRKAKIIRCPNYIEYCFVNMDGIAQNNYPIGTKSRRKRGRNKQKYKVSWKFEISRIL